MTPGEERLRDTGENRLLARFRELASAGLTPGVVLGSGDDAAILRAPENRLLLLTCDMMAEGVHFRLDWATPWQIGWKAMAQNLSDIAAMGGEPGYAVASVSLPGSAGAEVAEQLAAGLIAAAGEYGTALVGGDVVGSIGPLVVDVSVLGWVEAELALRRSGARPGDALLVTGSLGASAAGLKLLERGGRRRDDPVAQQVLAAHFTPRPRLGEARAIAATRLATAMMDLSDGLAEDLPRLCLESGVGARLWAARVPIPPACAGLAEELGEDPLALAVSGGEDYELLFTCPPEAVEEIRNTVKKARGTPVHVIGEITDERGIIMAGADGQELPLGRGFDHFRVG